MRSLPRPGNAFYISLCLLAFSLPFPFIFSTWCIWLCAACWLATGGYRHIRKGWRGMAVYWLWAVFFLLHAAGYFYCRDKTQSLFDTTSKLSFVLMPLLIGGGPDLRRPWLSRILTAFIAGISITALICFIHAIWLWAGDKDGSHFFYHGLVRGFDANAVYMSLYVLLAICILLFYKDGPLFPPAYVWLRRWLLALSIIFFAALACRLLLVLFIVVILPLYAFRGKAAQKFSGAKKVGGVALVVAVIISITATHNPIRQRFEDLLHRDARYAFIDDYHGKTPPDGNLTIRLFLWRVGLENVQQHRLWLHGSGNGDAHQLINQHIIALGIPDMDGSSAHVSNFWNVNLHNMYLQSLLMLGLPGLLLFLLLVLMPFFRLRRTSAPYLWLCFHLSAALFFMQEAALQTQAAIVFYTFWTAVFWRLVKASRNENSLATALQDY